MSYIQEKENEITKKIGRGKDRRGTLNKSNAIGVEYPRKGSEWVSMKGFIEGGPWQF